MGTNALKLNIKQWAAEDRPSEKMIRKGAGELADTELLALLIGSGTTRLTAVEVARNILDKFGNSLNTLGKARLEDLTAIEGIGSYTATRIMAAIELGRRREAESAKESLQINTATRLYRYLHPLMADLDVEQAYAIFLNQNFGLIKSLCVGRGGITSTVVDVRIIMREAVLCNATIVAVCHNHPSGNLSPSHADDNITTQIRRACETMRLHFMDHVIITDGQYFSYHEAGKL